jgi:signal transduction histidine kinase/DNA-binding NarL/FixJ family response regulator
MARSTSFTLLVIESSADELARLRHRLDQDSAADSATTLDATGIAEALDVLAKAPVDVMLLDLAPNVEENAVRRLRQAAPDVPIVIATDAAHESLAFESVQAGAQDYVITDLDDARVLWRSIKHAVERGSLARRRDALLIREHDARLAAEEARGEADRARAKAETLERRASFLGDAGAALSATLDPRATLATAVRLLVPALASAAAAFVVDDDGIPELVEAKDAESASAAHVLSVARRVVGREPVATVLAEARRRGYFVLDENTPRAQASTRQNGAGASNGRRSVVLIPLRGRERVRGLLVLLTCHDESDEREAVCMVAQAFAARAAAAVDNACLYEASRRATRTRDHVLGIVSHDLRNPLSAIGMCANALKKSEHLTTAERRRLVSTIDEAVDWTQRLLGDLVDVASIEAGRLSMDPARIDPIVLLGQALDLFEFGANDIVVTLAADVPESLPAIIGDEQRILQVIGALVSNARKVTPAGGVIALGAQLAGGSVRFSVADTGPGVAPEDQAHIFDWFWRASHERAERGTGLGLAIAKGIVEAHGGRIKVESTPGSGATFSFTIPLARPRSLAASTQQNTARRSADDLVGHAAK